jgi:hypothetical protein
MPVKEVIGYTISCEILGCAADAADDVSGGEYGSWNNLDELKELAGEEGWTSTASSFADRPTEWFCPAHTQTGVMAEPPMKDPTSLPPALFDTIEEDRS